MALATLAKVLPTLLQLLNANRGAYASTVGTNAATGIGAFPFDAEILDATLRADGHVITEGYFQSTQAFRTRFLAASANLANGARIPEFPGLMGKAEYSLDNITFKNSVKVGKEDVIGAAETGSYVGANAFAGLHYIDKVAGVVYHTSPYFRIEHPIYVRTAVLQANEYHEPAIIAFAMAFLAKERSNAAHEYYIKLGAGLLEKIIGGSINLDMPGAMPGGEG